MFKKNLISIPLVFVIFFIIGGLYNKYKKPNILLNSNLIKKFDQVNLPDSLLNVSTGNFFHFDSINNSMIIHYFTTDCSICAVELKEWELWQQLYISNECTDIVFIGFSDSPKRLQYIVEKQARVKLPMVLFDPDNKYHSSNFIVNKGFSETVLIDRNNTILAWGSPIHNVDIQSVYISKIDSVCNSNSTGM